jgi:ABC-type uncharacterized transport system permease subunit
LFSFEERHRRLLARLLLALILSAVVFVVGTILVWQTEGGRGDIGGPGDAAFFTAAQLLSVSSSMTNPVTSAGRGVDIFLEAWSIFVITAVAGSFASFFRSGDSDSS